MTTTIIQPTRQQLFSLKVKKQETRQSAKKNLLHQSSYFQAMSDDDLVSLTRQGQNAAFGELVNRYQTKVKSLALKITKNENDAQEVTQEVFLNAFSKLHSFKGTAAFSSWLYRVAANSALMLLRSRKKDSYELWEGSSAQTEYTAMNQSEWSLQADQIMERKELAAFLKTELSALPERYQTILSLRELEGLSNRDIAKTLGLSIAAVKSRLHRARLVMRKRILNQQKFSYC